MLYLFVITFTQGVYTFYPTVVYVEVSILFVKRVADVLHPGSLSIEGGAQTELQCIVTNKEVLHLKIWGFVYIRQ